MSATATTTPRGGTFAPLVICASLGLATEIYFVTLFGVAVLTRPYFWPGLLLSAFWVYCLIVRRFRPWHRYVWRFASIWSGIWTVFGVLFTFVPFAALAIPFPAWPWLEETGVNPYLALALHGFIWACCTDVLRAVPNPRKA
ncbi:hypothetical protein [Haloferula sp. BvORR071]|uniref:hypothetical protein n=1 Tax=Haloferula sp. BvORR071 TaxID=1396141 RepID=UPI000552D533|nr:hypothetical protein [Haloferula sp. BvORR071]